ncbi:MAG: hypothetical protein K1X94_18650, partial [Sandaracinaceae bacterium]|nr:hypothetical protein [Sandaracinaceae bacterium]
MPFKRMCTPATTASNVGAPGVAALELVAPVAGAELVMGGGGTASSVGATDGACALATAPLEEVEAADAEASLVAPASW